MPWILIDPGNPFLADIESCQFSLADQAHPVAYPLSWEPLDDAKRTGFLDQIQPRVTQPTELSFAHDGLAWVAVSSFSDSGEEVSEELGALIADIRKQRSRIGAAEALVIDVRGNLGGSSAAGYEVAGAIWGGDFIDARLPYFESTDWRASEANFERIDDVMIPMRLRFGSDSELYQKVSKIRAGLEGAIKDGQPFFVQQTLPNKPSDAAPLDLPGTIYLLTDADCVSACLDFVDLVRGLPGVVHVGRETSGDTRYLEVVTTELPSGLGNLVYPTAIHRGRERGDNVSHSPQFRFGGDIADTKALAAWLRERPDAEAVITEPGEPVG